MAVRARLVGPARVLLVMDAPLASLLSLTLNHGAFEVKHEPRVSDGIAAIGDWQPHLVIVDLDLEEGAGLGVVGRSESGGRTVPLIALTKRGDMRTKLAAFEHGADDFVAIPFSPEELVARVLSVMRRSYGRDVAFIPVIAIGDLRIDLANRHVQVGTKRLHLTSMEQALLYLLAANPGMILDRETILDTLWGTDYVAESNVVDRHVRNLRSKLRDDWQSPRFIETVPGKGYRFVDHLPPTVLHSAAQG